MANSNQRSSEHAVVRRRDESVVLSVVRSTDTWDLQASPVRCTTHQFRWDAGRPHWQMRSERGGEWQSSTVAQRLLAVCDDAVQWPMADGEQLTLRATACDRLLEDGHELTTAADVMVWRVTGSTGRVLDQGMAPTLSGLLPRNLGHDDQKLPTADDCEAWERRPIVFDGMAAAVIFHEMISHGSEWSGWRRGSRYWPISFDAIGLPLLGRSNDDLMQSVEVVNVVHEGCLLWRPPAIESEVGAGWWAAPHEATAGQRLLTITVRSEDESDWPKGRYIHVVGLDGAEFIGGWIHLRTSSAQLCDDGVAVSVMPPQSWLMSAEDFLGARLVPRRQDPVLGWCVRNGSWLPAYVDSPALCLERVPAHGLGPDN